MQHISMEKKRELNASAYKCVVACNKCAFTDFTFQQETRESTKVKIFLNNEGSLLRFDLIVLEMSARKLIFL